MCVIVEKFDPKKIYFGGGHATFIDPSSKCGAQLYN